MFNRIHLRLKFKLRCVERDPPPLFITKRIKYVGGATQIFLSHWLKSSCQHWTGYSIDLSRSIGFMRACYIYFR